MILLWQYNAHYISSTSSNPRTQVKTCSDSSKGFKALQTYTFSPKDVCVWADFWRKCCPRPMQMSHSEGYYYRPSWYICESLLGATEHLSIPIWAQTRQSVRQINDYCSGTISGRAHYSMNCSWSRAHYLKNILWIALKTALTIREQPYIRECALIARLR